ncbi:MAG: hypothetical protein HDQ88_04665 [Clostridia bacterium]|nr:hypothetical protein [Clostridia bacterium]
MSVIYARTSLPKTKYNMKNIIKVRPRYDNFISGGVNNIKNAPIFTREQVTKPNPPTGDTLGVSTNSMLFKAIGETKRLDITTNSNWVII